MPGGESCCSASRKHQRDHVSLANDVSDSTYPSPRFALPHRSSSGSEGGVAGNAPHPQPVGAFSSPAELVAVADLHGDYEKMRESLELVGIIDARGGWAAGSTHFVQTGDIVDRGRHSVKILQFMRQLQARPRRARRSRSRAAEASPPLAMLASRRRRPPPGGTSPCFWGTTSSRLWRG